MNITVTTFGCREYLAHTGRIPGKLFTVDITPAKPCVRDIQKAVSDAFNIPAKEMTSASHKRDVARPRQVAMYLSRQLTVRSLTEIGRLFGGRDHTTVIHAIRQIERLRLEDAELDKSIRRLSRMLRW